MKPLLIAIAVIALIGCAQEEVQMGPGTLIYRTGQITTCENITEVEPRTYNVPIRALLYVCHQADGKFQVRGSDLSSVKYHQQQPKTAPQSTIDPIKGLGYVDQGSYAYMRKERDRAEAGFLEACRDLARRAPALRAVPFACTGYFSTEMLMKDNQVSAAVDPRHLVNPDPRFCTGSPLWDSRPDAPVRCQENQGRTP